MKKRILIYKVKNKKNKLRAILFISPFLVFDLFILIISHRNRQELAGALLFCTPSIIILISLLFSGVRIYSDRLIATGFLFLKREVKIKSIELLDYGVVKEIGSSQLMKYRYNAESLLIHLHGKKSAGHFPLKSLGDLKIFIKKLIEINPNIKISEKLTTILIASSSE